MPKSFGLTIPNVLQLLSQPEELYDKLNIHMEKIFNSRNSSPYKSHYLVDTFIKYNVLGSVWDLLILLKLKYFYWKYYR